MTDVLTRLIDKASGSNPVYIGEAPAGSPTNKPVWRIQKLTYDAAGDVTNVQWAEAGNCNQIWDNRLSLTYA
ncbi:hypothetical protein [Asticcacaulis sp.]|uniref:hypothetical protein n=1 Tax=Asticcacaulis sp. TaxID=1872648 RepID=UPI0031DEAD19